MESRLDAFDWIVNFWIPNMHTTIVVIIWKNLFIVERVCISWIWHELITTHLCVCGWMILFENFETVVCPGNTWTNDNRELYLQTFQYHHWEPLNKPIFKRTHSFRTRTTEYLAEFTIHILSKIEKNLCKSLGFIFFGDLIGRFWWTYCSVCVPAFGLDIAPSS